MEPLPSSPFSLAPLTGSGGWAPRLASLGAFGLAFALHAAAASAQVPAAVRLEYTRGRGAERCPDEAQMRQTVSARLGYDPFRTDAHPSITAAIARRAGRLEAEIEVRDEGGRVVGQRVLHAAHTDCAELAAATSLAISIAVDPVQAGAVPAGVQAATGERAARAPVAPPPAAPPSSAQQTADALPNAGAPDDRDDDPLTLAPAPGRVPVVIESTGAAQRVAAVLGTTQLQYGATTLTNVYGVHARDLCTTPCTAYARPGLVSITTRREGLRPGRAELDVPPGGLRVRMYASQEGTFTAGAILATTGGALALGGVLFMVMSPIGFDSDAFNNSDPYATSHDAHMGPLLLGIGGVLTAAGAALFVPGLLMALANPSGPARIEPLRATGPRLDGLAVAPARGGAVAVAALRF